MNEWIDQLRPGDEVSVVRGFCHVPVEQWGLSGFVRLAKVVRKTKTLVITNCGGRWRRADGMEHGPKHDLDSAITKVTADHRNIVEHRTLVGTLAALGVSDWRELDLKTLRTIDVIRRGRG